MPSFYDILGLKQDASADAIRRAFRRQAKALHPDKDSGTEAEMVRLNEAYDTLKDPDKREAYDATLRPAYRLPQRPAEAPPTLDPMEFLARVLLPLDRQLAVALQFLDEAIAELAYDLYDDRYIERFGRAVEGAQAAMTQIDRKLMGAEWPGPLASALNLYSQGLRQVEDAIEDFETFTLNFDSDLLVEGRAMIRLARELLDEARQRLHV
jgi:curved DNA-binding protein CbpA